MKIRHRGWQHLATIAALLMLGGCGSGRTLVVDTPQRAMVASSVAIERTTHAVQVPAEMEQEFEKNLRSRLYEKAGFQEGNELHIRYRFVQFDPGNQFSRWFWGGLGNTGEGSLTIEAKFTDASGSELSTIQAQGTINSGFFGGSFGLALDKAAQEIAEYTTANYGAAPAEP
jgi:hypothetical protein